MRLKTKHFGELSIDEKKIIFFEDGLPGFPSDKRFILLQQEGNQVEDKDNLFWWLQSIEDGDVAFVLMNVFLVMPDYNPKVDEEELNTLGDCSNPEDLLVYNIASIPDDVAKTSVNLKAPLVINAKTQKAKQIIVENDDYPIRFHIIEALNNRK